jgi:hypothetical protein
VVVQPVADLVEDRLPFRERALADAYRPSRGKRDLATCKSSHTAMRNVATHPRTASEITQPRLAYTIIAADPKATADDESVISMREVLGRMQQARMSRRSIDTAGAGGATRPITAMGGARSAVGSAAPAKSGIPRQVRPQGRVRPAGNRNGQFIFHRLPPGKTFSTV